MLTLCPYGHDVLTLCPYGHDVLTLCPYGHDVLTLCPYGHDVLTLCPYRHDVLIYTVYHKKVKVRSYIALDCSKCFTLHPLAATHAAISARTLFFHISIHLCL